MGRKFSGIVLFVGMFSTVFIVGTYDFLKQSELQPLLSQYEIDKIPNVKYMDQGQLVQYLKSENAEKYAPVISYMQSMFLVRTLILLSGVGVSITCWLLLLRRERKKKT